MTRKEFLKLPLYAVLSLILGSVLGKQLYDWFSPKPKPALKLGKGIYEQMKESNRYEYRKLDIKELEKTIADFYWKHPYPRTQKIWYNGKIYEI
jgi:hypothetical protein